MYTVTTTLLAVKKVIRQRLLPSGFGALQLLISEKGQEQSSSGHKFLLHLSSEHKHTLSSPCKNKQTSLILKTYFSLKYIRFLSHCVRIDWLIWTQKMPKKAYSEYQKNKTENYSVSMPEQSLQVSITFPQVIHLWLL